MGARQPCPCGSGRRYKACHGATRADVTAVARPFAGLASEAEWVALREIVPSATAPLPLAPGVGAGREVTLCTVLPLLWDALVRQDGRILLAVQTAPRSGDLGRDLAQALEAALAAEPGSGVSNLPRPAAGPRLPELLAAEPLAVTVHEGFDWWVDQAAALTPEVATSLERANASVVPTARLAAVDAAYWARIGGKCHLRWVLPHDEDVALDGLARLHAAGELTLGAGSRYVGAFRAHGLLIPVWDVDEEASAETLEAPVGELDRKLRDVLATPRALTADERRARAGLIGRSLTLR